MNLFYDMIMVTFMIIIICSSILRPTAPVFVRVAATSGIILLILKAIKLLYNSFIDENDMLDAYYNTKLNRYLVEKIKSGEHVTQCDISEFKKKLETQINKN